LLGVHVWKPAENFSSAAIGIIVVNFAILIPGYPGVQGDCCMGYNNSSAKPAGGGGMLYFLQQFPVTADLMKGMLYFVQEF
jgi:hypothetical protein